MDVILIVFYIVLISVALFITGAPWNLMDVLKDLVRTAKEFRIFKNK